jgi:hypothetical protein
MASPSRSAGMPRARTAIPALRRCSATVVLCSFQRLASACILSPAWYSAISRWARSGVSRCCTCRFGTIFDLLRRRSRKGRASARVLRRDECFELPPLRAFSRASRMSTFSTASYETVRLLEERRALAATVNALRHAAGWDRARRARVYRWPADHARAQPCPEPLTATVSW